MSNSPKKWERNFSLWPSCISEIAKTLGLALLSLQIVIDRIVMIIYNSILDLCSERADVRETIELRSKNLSNPNSDQIITQPQNARLFSFHVLERYGRKPGSILDLL